MNKSLRKCLIVSTSALMLFSLGSGVSNVNAKNRPSTTTQIVRLKNKRTNLKKQMSKDSLTIRNINRQIKKLENRRTTVNRKWRTGMPKFFSKKAYWAGSKRFVSRNGDYMRYQTPLSSTEGVSFTTPEYNRHNHITNIGAGSAYAEVNPHYESLGHGWYRLASGSMSKKDSLNKELHNMPGSVELLHMHGKNHFSMWFYRYDGKGKPYYTAKKTYMGYFTRYSTYNALNKALGHFNVGE